MKYIVLTLFTVLVLGFAANSFATSQASDWLDRQPSGDVVIPGTDPRPALNVKPSANVFFAWGVESTGVSYTIGTIHTSGTFTYATSSTDTNIYRFANAAQASTSLTAYDGDAQLPPASPEGATGLVTWGDGWTASK